MIDRLLSFISTSNAFVVLWGWLMTINYLIIYFLYTSHFSLQLREFLFYAVGALPIIGIITSLILINRRPWRNGKYRIVYVWLAAIIAMMLINLIQAQVLDSVNFELQHPIFMVVTSIALVVTGLMMPSRSIIAGGICFAILAFVASLYPLSDQMLIEAMAWFIALGLPGHYMVIRRRTKNI
jgi:hypothetical protein